MLDKVEVAAELQHRMLADRMVGREEGTEVQTGHERISWLRNGHDALSPTLPSLGPLGRLYSRRCRFSGCLRRCTEAITEARWLGSTGLTTCASKPAASAACRSAGCP